MSCVTWRIWNDFPDCFMQGGLEERKGYIEPGEKRQA